MKQRLDSLDILRGFDMFFITGGNTLVVGLAAVLGFFPEIAKVQMDHVVWEGITHHDTIFPLFIFLAGVSWPFSYAAQVAKKASAWAIHRKIFMRMLTLFLIGLSFGGLPYFKPNFRIMHVLAFIGFSWGWAALLYIHLKSTCNRVIAALIILVGYAALLNFVPSPDASAEALAGPIGVYAKEANIIPWLDAKFYGNHLYMKIGKGFLFEPESIFMTIQGAALAMLGMLGGTWLRREDRTPSQKALGLFLAAVVALVLTLGARFGLGIQFVKNLWTTSFVLAMASYSFFMLALFYWLVDVRGWSGWGVAFRCIGRNSILVYMFNLIHITSPVQKWLFKGCLRTDIGITSEWHTLIAGLTYFLTAWAIFYYLDKKQVYLKA